MTQPTLTTTEAGELMHIGENAVLELIKDGDLPAAKLGKAFTLLTEDVLNYIRKEANRQTQERRNSKTGTTVPSQPTKRRRRLADTLAQALLD
jgi:excisionase family DNA binding protein